MDERLLRRSFSVTERGLLSTHEHAVLGERLADRYLVEHVLGQGTFGRVYRALDTDTGERVALKEFVRQPGRVDSFLRELGILFELRHPHVIACRTLVMGGPFRYLVCEHMDGGSLRDLLESGQQSVLALVELLHQTMEGVEYAHDRNVIHRDLKPENILVARQAHGYRAKVSDFGISTLGTSLGTRSCIGSPAYMAPEQFYDQYDTRVDVYALGVMLYEILCGKRPFGGSPAQLMNGHLRSEPEVPLWLPKRFSRILAKALAKKPERRFARVELFREALRLAIASEGKLLDSVVWPAELGAVLEVAHAHDEILVRRADDVLRLDRAGRIIASHPRADRIGGAGSAFYIQRGHHVEVGTAGSRRTHRGFPDGAAFALTTDGTIACVRAGKAIVVDGGGRHDVGGDRAIDAACFVGRERTLCLAWRDGEGSVLSFAGTQVRVPMTVDRLHGHPDRYELIARAAGGDPRFALIRPDRVIEAALPCGDFSTDGEAFFAVTDDGELASIDVATARIAKTRWEERLCCVSAGRDRFVWATREGRVLCT